MNLRQVLNNSKIGLLDKVNFVKTQIKPSEYYKTFNNNRILKQVLSKNQFPDKIEKIKVNEPFQFTNNFNDEFQWIASKIILNLNEINNYIILKEEFDISLLKNDYTNSRNVLEQITSTLGYSLWSIESDLHLVEEEIGSNENWQKLSNYLKIIQNPFYEFCINASSKKIEKDLSFESYVNQVQNDINTINANDLIKDFFVFNNFKLANYNYDFSDLKSVLYISNLFSLIDQYNTIIDVIIYNINNKKSQYYNLFREFVYKIIKAENSDYRVKNIYNYLSQEDFIADKNLLITNSIIEQYYNGNFDISLIDSKQYILKNPLDFEIYETYVKSIINLKRDFEGIGLESIDNILLTLFNFLQFEKDTEKYGKKLLKYALKYSNSILGFQIMDFLSHVDNNKTDSLRHSFYSGHYKIALHKFPNLISQDLEDLFNKYNFYNYKKILFGIKNIDINTFSTIDNLLKINAEITSHYNNNDYKNVIQIITNKEQECSTINYYKERFIYLLFNSYIKDDNIEEALNLFGIIFFDETTYYLKINFKELYEHTFKDNNKFKYSENIHSLILASLYQSEYNLYEIIDEYICSQEIHVKEVINIKGLKHEVHVYLLNKICTIDTIKYYFGCINDAEEFRLKILSYLITIDNINKKSYRDEIDEINKKISVRNVIKEVNNGRLFVDIDKLKEQLIEKYNDDFNRLLRIVGEKKNNTLVGFNASKPRNWETSMKEQITEESNKYNDADFIAFKNIYYEVREQFLFSKEYGLDSSLSTRIRHGALENQIRSVFEKLNLVTTKLNNEYIDSEYWNSQNLNIQNLKRIQDELKEFSKNIDNLTSGLKNNIIQITHEKIQNMYAVFNYTTNDELLYNYYVEYKDKFQTTENTIDLLLNYFAHTTNFIICPQIHDFLQKAVFQEFEKNVRNFIANIPNNLPNEIYLLENLNQSLTNLQFNLEEICGWFWLETSSSSQLILIEDVINASSEITQRLYNNIKINFELKNNEKEIQCYSYSSLIYVFNILFSNAVVHSGLDEEIYINVDLSIVDNKYIRIDIKNNYYDIDLVKAKSNLQIVKSTWADFKNIERSNIEGESGFHKIKRIMIHEAKCMTEKFDFDITSDMITISLYLLFEKNFQDETTYN